MLSTAVSTRRCPTVAHNPNLQLIYEDSNRVQLVVLVLRIHLQTLSSAEWFMLGREVLTSSSRLGCGYLPIRELETHPYTMNKTSTVASRDRDEPRMR